MKKILKNWGRRKRKVLEVFVVCCDGEEEEEEGVEEAGVKLKVK